jgi:hypothetical protein
MDKILIYVSTDSEIDMTLLTWHFSSTLMEFSPQNFTIFFVVYHYRNKLQNLLDIFYSIEY